MIPKMKSLILQFPRSPKFGYSGSVVGFPRYTRGHEGIVVFLITAALLVFRVHDPSAFHPPTTDAATAQVDSQNVQASQTENQASLPEYFPPAGRTYG